MKSAHKFLLVSAAALVLAGFASTALASAIVWNNAGTDYNTAANWTGLAAPGTSDVATFSAVPANQPNISTSLTNQGLDFSAAAGAYTLSATAGQALTLTSTSPTASSAAITSSNTSGTNTISADLVLGGASSSTQTFMRSGAGGNLILSGVISGADASVTLNLASTASTGLLTVSGTNNSYAGNTLISGAGTTAVNSIGNAGSNSSLGAGTAVNIGSGATAGLLSYIGAGETTGKTINMNGSAGGGTTLTANGTGTWTVNTLVNATAGAKTLTLNGNNTGLNTLASNLADNGVLTLAKSGTGTWVLSGTSNAQTGATTISSGVLIYTNAGAIAGSTRNVTVSVSGTAGAGYAMDQGFLLRMLNTSAGTVALAADSTNNLDFSAAGANMTAASLGATGAFTYSGTLTPNGTTYRLGGGGGTLTVSSVLSGGSNTLAVIGSTVALTNTNTFGGNTTVSGDATLVVSSIGNQGVASGNLGSGTTINLGSTSGPTGGKLRYIGAGETSNRIINLASTTQAGTIDTTGASGALILTANLTATGAGVKTLALTGDNTTGTITNKISGAIVDNSGTNTTSVQKNGAGTWTLGGNNTYSGGTAVFAGRLGFASDTALGTASLSFGSANTAEVFADGVDVTLANNVSIGGTTTTNATFSGSKSITFTGATVTGGAAGSSALKSRNIINNITGSGVLTFNGAYVNSQGSAATQRLGFSGTGNTVYNGEIRNSVVGGAPTIVAFSGPGTLTLAGPNSYGGSTSVSQGILIAGADSLVSTNGAFGNAASVVNLGSASLTGDAGILTNGAFTIGRSITEVASSTNASISIGGKQTSGTSTYTGNIILAKDTILTSAVNGEVDFTTGVISGAFSTIIDGGGTVLLSGTNTFGGAAKSITIQGGTTLIASTGATGGNTNLGSTSNSLVFNNGTLKFGAAFDASTRSTTFQSGGATFNTNGNTVNFANAVGSGGAGQLTKTGTGSLTLSAASSYTGGTTVSTGTLVLAASNTLTSATGTMAVSGGTLSTSVANSTLGGDLSLSSGILDPNGSSVGSLTLAANKNLSITGGTFNVMLLGATTSDQIIGSGTGTFTITGGTFALDVSNGGFGGYGVSYQLVNGFTSGSVTNPAFTGYDTANWTAALGTNGVLSFTAVPEPSTWALLTVSLTTVMVLRRRRQS